MSTTYVTYIEVRIPEWNKDLSRSRNTSTSIKRLRYRPRGKEPQTTSPCQLTQHLVRPHIPIHPPTKLCHAARPRRTAKWSIPLGLLLLLRRRLSPSLFLSPYVSRRRKKLLLLRVSIFRLFLVSFFHSSSPSLTDFITISLCFHVLLETKKKAEWLCFEPAQSSCKVLLRLHWCFDDVVASIKLWKGTFSFYFFLIPIELSLKRLIYLFPSSSGSVSSSWSFLALSSITSACSFFLLELLSWAFVLPSLLPRTTT